MNKRLNISNKRYQQVSKSSNTKCLNQRQVYDLNNNCPTGTSWSQQSTVTTFYNFV